MFEELSDVERKLFYEQCVQSWDEFQEGKCYETIGKNRFIVVSNEPETIKFRGLGFYSKGVWFTAIKLFVVDKRAEPLKWYVGKLVELNNDQLDLFSVSTSGEVKEKRESSGEARISTHVIIKQHLDAGNELDEEGFFSFLKTNRPDIMESNYKQHLRSFIMKKYPTKVKVEGGKIKSIVQGTDYDF